MGKLLIGLWLLTFAAPALGAGEEQSIGKQTSRLEETLQRNRRLQKSQEQMLQALARAKEERLKKTPDNIAQALMSLQVKDLPNPLTAEEKARELAVQASLTEFAAGRFDELARSEDTDLTAATPPKVDAETKVTSLPILKAVLDRIGDKALEEESALSAIAEMARERAEKIKAQEKGSGSETEPAPDAKPVDVPDEGDESFVSFVSHPEKKEPEEKAPEKPKNDLHNLIATEFSKGAKIATEYFKDAEKIIGPVRETERAESERPQDLAGDPSLPSGEGATPPGGEATPPGGQGQGQGQGQPKKPNNQAKKQNQGQGGGGSGGGGSGGGGEGGDKSGSGSSAGAQVPTPGGVPKVVMADQPKEADVSAVAEVTKSFAQPAPANSFVPSVTPPIQPTLGLKPQAQNQIAAAEQPSRDPASLQGNRFPGAGAPSPSGAGSESASPSSPKGDTYNGAPTGGLSSGGDPGIFSNIGPKYPGRDETRNFRQSVAFVSGSEVDDEAGPGTLATGAGQPPSGFVPIALGPKNHSDHRGILSHVGEWCRRTGAGTIAMCSR